MRITFKKAEEHELTKLAAFFEPDAVGYWPPQHFKSAFADNKTIVELGLSEDDAEPVLSLVYRVVLDEAELLHVGVKPERRGQGLGKTAMRRLEARCVELFATLLFLEVHEQNTAARALYAGCGFEEVGRRRNYYRHPPGDAVVMHKRLGPALGPC